MAIAAPGGWGGGSRAGQAHLSKAEAFKAEWAGEQVSVV